MEPIRVGEFAFTVQAGNPPNCVALEKRWEPLAAAFTAAGGGLEEMIARRSGMNKEGAVGFYWGDPSRPATSFAPTRSARTTSATRSSSTRSSSPRRPRRG
ncbi:MAG: hypothetical protein M0D55_17130 [Elusimicrobiota bacterium]|nr:MAG: hypothetical protein M0D55_17130 [Elusimicrobiota bacterium]